MAKIADDVTKLIGNTPLVRLNRIASGLGTEIEQSLNFSIPVEV